MVNRFRLTPGQSISVDSVQSQSQDLVGLAAGYILQTPKVFIQNLSSAAVHIIAGVPGIMLYEASRLPNEQQLVR